mgnify:CR=1 FL=1
MLDILKNRHHLYPRHAFTGIVLMKKILFSKKSWFLEAINFSNAWITNRGSVSEHFMTPNFRKDENLLERSANIESVRDVLRPSWNSYERVRISRVVNILKKARLEKYEIQNFECRVDFLKIPNNLKDSVLKNSNRTNERSNVGWTQIWCDFLRHESMATGREKERRNSKRRFECQCTRVIRTLLEANEQMQVCETVSVAGANFSRFRALVKTSTTAVEWRRKRRRKQKAKKKKKRT